MNKKQIGLTYYNNCGALKDSYFGSFEFEKFTNIHLLKG